MEQADKFAIEDLMKRYVDGLYHCDTNVLRSVFHENLSYANANPGQHEFLGLEAYLQRVEERTPPASRNEPRKASIEKIELSGREMGFVEARATMWDRDYTDLLTIIRTGEEWRILNKVFTFVELEG